MEELPSPPPATVRLVVNGRPYELSLDSRTTLLHALRETLNKVLAGLAQPTA